MTKRCVQGSVCGPTFWNTILDELLNLPLPSGCVIQAFADDVLLNVSTESVKDLETSYLETIKRKSYRSQKSNKAKIEMNGVRLSFVDDIKLLGVIIDKCLKFVKHARYVLTKAQRIFTNLSRFERPTWGVHPENIITIYKQVVEPTITYAAAIWGNATKFYYIRRLFQMFQRTFAIRAIRAFHTVSLTSALALSRFIPLHLKMSECMKLDEVKRTGTLEHTSDTSLQSRVQQHQQLHPADRQTITYRTVNTQEELNSLDTFDCIQIYTNGSKQETSESKAAFVISRQINSWENFMFKLHDTCTVFQAEALAIDRALEWAEFNMTSKTLQVFSDSKSCLEAIKNRGNDLPLISSIHNRLHHLRQHLVVEFFWIKAHVGIEGNEAADNYAKQASTLTVDATYSQFPLSYAKRELRLQTEAKWQKEYEEANTGKTTKIFFKSTSEAKIYADAFGISFELTQILTGHGYHKQYLKRFNITDQGCSPCDGETSQTLDHLLHECLCYASERRSYTLLCEHQIPAFNMVAISAHIQLTEFFKKLIKFFKSLTHKFVHLGTTQLDLMTTIACIN
ncbi:PREDICTED: uncharacterized protein LOC108369677 [Rhagoletis zephyria]|uniref:uncharacterized protein LOC108369677 n=1 Tax=Rhagoletis zephyria TaxID=28612 RepID=UPI0008116514|nr:PREDICTED: uncharacterized protein LOC108369677 [Rhagoletis zephyria]